MDEAETRLEALGLTRPEPGSLDRVRVLELVGTAKAVPDFADHPEVINGCSDLFAAVLGDAGRHARPAAGKGSLPNGMAVEIERILALEA